ncbi:MAG: ankyrin repeat domain-containing protein, partial [Microcoleus sp.]
LLVENGADVNVRDDSGATALMWAAHRGCAGAVKILIDAVADINHKNLGNYTALMLAEFNGYKEVVKLLKSAGSRE